MAKKYSKVNPNNPVGNLFHVEAQWRRNTQGKTMLDLQSENYWLKDCYRPSYERLLNIDRSKLLGGEKTRVGIAVRTGSSVSTRSFKTR
jgi:hypothetical protein